MTALIEASGLRKNFGRVRALDGLDLSVDAGEVHGFLGPNGAGKSTTLRVLLGLIRASGGTTSVFGLDPWREAVQLHRRLSYVPGDVNLWPGLTGGEVIDLLTSLRGGVDDALRAELVEEFEFDPRTRSRNYSKGNRQKVVLIAALARPADLYLFDEPTSGLDPVMEAVFRRRDRAALQPHPERGRTTLRPGHDHPCGKDRGDRDAPRPPPPHPHELPRGDRCGRGDHHGPARGARRPSGR
jgi:ABC-2 type transport system ATP-binding protein